MNRSIQTYRPTKSQNRTAQPKTDVNSVRHNHVIIKVRKEVLETLVLWA